MKKRNTTEDITGLIMIPLGILNIMLSVQIVMFWQLILGIFILIVGLIYINKIGEIRRYFSRN